MTVTEPELVDARYCADKFGVSLWTIHRWLNAGKIPGRKIGQRWYIKRDLLDEAVAPNNQALTGDEAAS